PKIDRREDEDAEDGHHDDEGECSLDPVIARIGNVEITEPACELPAGGRRHRREHWKEPEEAPRQLLADGAAQARVEPSQDRAEHEPHEEVDAGPGQAEEDMHPVEEPERL